MENTELDLSIGAINEMNKLLSNKGFIVDRIINETNFRRSKEQILWILKEPNSDENHWSYQGYLSKKEIERKKGKEKDTLKYSIFKKILYTSYGILHSDKWQSVEDYWHIPEITEEEVYSVGESIALINLKKKGGGGSSNKKDIESSYNELKNILLNQISLINPTVIIFGNTKLFFNNDLKEIGWDISNEIKTYASNETNNTACYDLGNKLVIDAYHPAWWILSNFVYCSEIIDGYYKWKNKKIDFI